jgi:hypothetical protein
MNKISSVIVRNGKRLIPLSEYKGQKLKLTEQESQTIQLLEKKINDNMADALAFRAIADRLDLPMERRRFYYDQVCDAEVAVLDAKQKIAEIKEKRRFLQELNSNKT